MKKTSFIVALLMSVPFQVAAASSADNSHVKRVDFVYHNLDVVDAKSIDCDQFMKVVASKELVIANHQVVAGSAEECNYIQSADYDYFQPTGSYLSTRDGVCIVWSCNGKLDSDDSRD